MAVVSDAGRSSGDLMYRVAELERAIRDLQTARRLEAAAVGTGGIRIHSGGSARLQGGGSLEVQDGGDILVEGGNVDVTDGTVRLLDTDGNATVVIRRTPAGGGEVSTFHPNGTVHTIIGQLILEATGEIVGQGFFTGQDDGTDIFGAGPITPGGPSVIRARDTNGHLVFITRSNGGWSLFGENETLVASTDETHPELLNRPYMDVPMYVNNSSGTHEYPLTSFTDMWRGRMFVTHPALHAHVFAWVTDASTTGEVAVQIDGVTTHAITQITNAGPPGLFYDLGTELLPSSVRAAPYSFAPVAIRARVTAGTGSVVIIPYGFTKRGTP